MAPPVSRVRAAFTLLELIISVGLSSVLVLTLFAGVRGAVAAMTIANRLSIENQLGRAAFTRALDYLDFWTDLDDPESTSSQRYRGHTDAGGLPFTPLSQVRPAGSTGADGEDSIGWRASDPWPAHDARCWFHGQPMQKVSTDIRNGFSTIFTCATPQPSLTSPIDYGSPEVPHRWWDRQLWDMHAALGYYAFLDYMPAHVLYGCHLQPDGTTSADGVPHTFIENNGTFCNGDGAQAYPYGRFRLTAASNFAVRSTGIGLDGSALPPGEALAPDVLVGEHQRLYATSYWYGDSGSDTSAADFRAKTTMTHALLPLRPASWPATTVLVSRFITHGRFTSELRLRSISPLTGELAELTFVASTTTLRGARQQRRHPQAGGGWAAWHNDGRVIDRTLDD